VVQELTISEKFETIIEELDRLNANLAQQQSNTQHLLDEIEALKRMTGEHQEGAKYCKNQHNKAQEHIEKLEKQYDDLDNRNFLIGVDLGPRRKCHPRAAAED
jgi:predicted  nucleic acid-binding Zn-ribbon protein